jgi:NADPH:quinone reductase-like Zn-dependent oxidoreductase/NADP-dependent 3-hydroxy acid dehydrogenase YdfG/acyl carrier protein
VISVESLITRPAGELGATGSGALYTVEWVPLPVPAAGPAQWAVIGADPVGLGDVRTYPGLADLVDAVASGAPVPDAVAVGLVSSPEDDVAGAVRECTERTLELIQAWLAEDRLAPATLVVVSSGAVSTGGQEGVADLPAAAAWGLLRSAQSENPGRIVMVDRPDATLLPAALATGEPELAIRSGKIYARRLARPSAALPVPAGDLPWRLEIVEKGSVDGLALRAYAPQPLAAGQVRIAVRATGVNFRDLAITLGLVERGELRIGSDVAGVVAETGPGVSGLAPGDRVVGVAVADGGFGPLVVTDARTVVPLPDGWTFAQAASVPVAFLTAWYGLVDLAGARRGQKLLIHAATGAVGMAAVTVARQLGLEIYATASPAKHPVLLGMGLPADHIASSRTAGFADAFPPVDIVLNALAGELTDASLRLLRPGGRFLEMGKTDIRDAAVIARDHPGVAYRAYDVSEAGPERLGQILTRVTGLLADGQLAPVPVHCWDVRRAREAFRFMAQARHVGKIVLTVPETGRPAGTVLVTGGTGLLGGLVARHLAGTGRAAELVLTSRSGPGAQGAAALAADLAAGGTAVRVTACDSADRNALATLLARLAATQRPLTGVVHTAGVLDDGVIESLTAERFRTVMRPKVDAAWHLHELTRDADLDFFVLFSSASGVLGSAGQGGYCAANTFLDVLAAVRRSSGRPAQSLAWGLWSDASTMTSHLTSERDSALTSREGLALFDLATARDEALLVLAPLDPASLRGNDVPALLRGLSGSPAAPRAATPVAAPAVTGAGPTLRQRLAGMPVPERDRLLVDLVRAHASAVLGQDGQPVIEAGRAFRDLGLDSLSAVQLRNRLSTATGLTLPATVVFNHSTPAALAAHLRDRLTDGRADLLKDVDRIAATLAALPGDDDGRREVADRLEEMVRGLRAQRSAAADREVSAATDEEMFDLIDRELGRS